MSDEELLAQGYRKYYGRDIDIYFNTNVCEHSGVCVRGNKEVFNLERKPWIAPDNASDTDIAQLIDRCPSGALKYIKK